MAVSKRLRFEVLRRDNYTCRYCGGVAPAVTLTVDHVVPTALGGTDEPKNLVAACADCNSGKTSSNPDAPLVETVNDDAIRWAKAMQQAAEERSTERGHAARFHALFAEEWDAWKRFGRVPAKPGGWRATIDQLLKAGLSMDDLFQLIEVAMQSRADDVWRYFCGCCWKRVGVLQERASEIVAGDEQPATVRPLSTGWTSQYLDAHVEDAERFAGRLLSQQSIESCYCCHRAWGQGDCGDPLCRIVRAEALKWLADRVLLDEMRDDQLMDEAEALIDG